MPRVNQDLRAGEEQEDMSFEPMKGIYFVEIDESDGGTEETPRYSKSGHFMVKVTYRVLAKEPDDDKLIGKGRCACHSDQEFNEKLDHDFKGRLIWDNITFHPDMQSRNIRVLKIMEQPLDGSSNSDEWASHKFRIRVSPAEYVNNSGVTKTKTEVKGYLYWSEAEAERIRKLYEEKNTTNQSLDGKHGGF